MPPFDELVRSRFLSLVLVLSILLIAFVLTWSAEKVLQILAAVVLPLACIWYSDELGSLTGFSTGLARPHVTEPTPGIFVAIGGWIALFATMTAVIIVNQ